MSPARLSRFALLAAASLAACSSSQATGASPSDASLDGPVDDAGADSGPDAPDARPTTGTATLDVNGAGYEVSGDFLVGYGATSEFNEAADNAIVNVDVQWAGAGVGTYPCTFALVYVFAATQLACDYDFSSTPDPITGRLTGGTCSVAITADGPNEGDFVTGSFTASLGPNPNSHNMTSCRNPAALEGTFSQPRPTSADAG